MHDVQAVHELQALQFDNVDAHSAHAVVDDEQYPALHAVQVVAVAFGQVAQFETVQAAFESISRCPKQMRISKIRVLVTIWGSISIL